MRAVLAMLIACTAFFCPVILAKDPESLADRARKGDANAAYDLAIEHFFGRKRPVNLILAVYWFRRAADAGHTASQYNLARCFERGWGCRKSNAMAALYYRRAMQGNLAEAMARYAELLYSGVPAEKSEYGDFPALKADKEQALQLMRKAAEVSEYGKLLLARYLFKDAPRHGAELRRRLAGYVKRPDVGPEALLLYSACLRSGIGGDIDISAGVKFLQQAADRGNAEALAQLAEILFNGTGLPPDHDKAMKLTRRAVKLGNQRAMVNLGRMYLAGVGVDYDPAKAVRFFRLAGKSGYPPALCALGDCFARGTGVEQSWTNAVENYRLAASGGDETAAWKLGDCYNQASGVAKDDVSAYNWYRRSALAGSFVGMRKMAIALLDGRGVRKDRENGLKLLRKAAEGGDENARFLLEQKSE